MLCFQTKDYLLQFDEQAGVIASLQNAGREYVAEKVSVFRLALRNLDCSQKILTAADLPLHNCTSDQEGFTATYSANGVSVTVSAVMDTQIQWQIQVATPKNAAAEWVNFPQIIVPNDLKGKGGVSEILWGFNEGCIVEDLDIRESGFRYLEPEYPSQGVMGMYPAIVETQFMAFMSEQSSLYFAAHDKDDNLKGIDFHEEGCGILLQFRHFCGVNFGQTYEMTFPMVMQFFTGSWYVAAEIYRQWFREAKKDQFIPITENKKLPTWYGESPVIVTYPVRGIHDTDIMNPNKLFPYMNAMPHVERLEKELGCKIMVLLMHWEGSAPWAPPYVWPPYGGEDALKEFIDALHARGDVLGVYCSGMGWTEQSNLVAEYNTEAQFKEQNLQNVMCLSPEQTLPHSLICTGQRSGYDMCPTQEFTHQVLTNEVRQMAASGIDYIQLMDQNHGGTSYFCYSREHGHPPVPGKWQVDAVKELLNEVNADIGQVLLGCESAAAEAYIPQLLFSDNRFNLNYRIGKPVPMYAYIYHEYVNNFMGNQVCSQFHTDPTKSPDCVLERLAYSFSAGDMLTLVINEDGGINWCWGQRPFNGMPEQEPIKTLIRNLNPWRLGVGKQYLHSGTMVAPWTVHCGEHPMYRPDDSAAMVAKIHHTAWQAPDGSVGQILINYHQEAISCTIDLPEGNCKLYQDGSNWTALPGGSQEITIPALSAVLVVKEN